MSGGQSPTALANREKRASVGIAIAFVVLGVTVGSSAISHLAEDSHTTGQVALLALSIPSIFIFLTLATLKVGTPVIPPAWLPISFLVASC